MAPCRVGLLLALAVVAPGLEAQTVCQLEATGATSAYAFDLSADGGWLALVTEEDLLGSNPDGSGEVFVYGVADGSLAQLTDALAPPGAGLSVAVSADGGVIAYLDEADGTHYLLDRLTGAVEPLFPRVERLTMNADATRFAVLASADFTGGNADGNGEVFHFDRTSGGWRQLTDTDDLGLCFFPSICPSNQWPTISADGSTIAFASDFDLLGDPADVEPGVYLVDPVDGAVDRIASQLYGGGFPVLVSGDGNRIAYRPEGGDVEVWDRAAGVALTASPFDFVFFTGAKAIDVDGSHLLFANRSFGDARIYRYEPDFDRLIPLTPELAFVSRTMDLDDSGEVAAVVTHPTSSLGDEGDLAALRCRGAAVTDIPTLDAWAAALLTLLLGVAGLWALPRKPPAPLA